MIRCERCNLAISDGDMVARIGLCPWCWEDDMRKWEEWKCLTALFSTIELDYELTLPLCAVPA
ncbi:MAG: hypothetical protein A2Y91_06485 [Chloroflexi bacterium RBG_13_54_8]|nr:MAG: hypothetical protein A2Y91_06485 [Chloroflexi bacterium RBG_13_54_8]